MNSTIQASDLHGEITEWKNLVNTVRDELKKFNSSLTEVVKKRNADAMPFVEHFQNQFIRHSEVSDELFHDLKQADKAIKLKAEENGSDVNQLTVDDPEELRSRTSSYQKIFDELKSEYNSFLTKYN
ncbi:hypothetical protein C3K47_06505 [Solitalea longa]|uniref:Uncharacterized protein n=1 Tax=Solitalea longa TaxID=2079460 RepID=A0A2S5A4A2_9SPHI|nr:hypothetical protein [Solitalea longa]POY37408.1 hypothetical protein C3K47_06505 [Solitalea longa]